MKNISLLFNLVLAVLVGILFYLQFKNKDCCTKPNVAAVHSNDSTGTTTPQGLTIAYINSDSLFDKYKFAVQLKGDLEAKEKQMQNDIESRGRGLETEMRTAQEKVATMTADEARSTEERLGKKQQQLLADRDKLGNQLAQFNENVNKQLADTITVFLKQFNETKGYDYIVNYTANAPILLYKNEAHDVTNEVIAAMNARWDARKK